METENQTKRKCGKCLKEKILSTEYFHKEIRGKDGFNSTCKDCKNEYRNKPEIKEKAKARSKEYHKSDEFKEKNIEVRIMFKKKN